MKVLSLFSGVGGFDMGLENAGMETVFQCEWDKHCLTILDRHWPDVPKWDDISTLTGKHILAGVPVIDVVAWGSPCQDLSVAGKRAGLEGGTSNLFYEGTIFIIVLFLFHFLFLFSPFAFSLFLISNFHNYKNIGISPRILHC